MAQAIVLLVAMSAAAPVLAALYEYEDGALGDGVHFFAHAKKRKIATRSCARRRSTWTAPMAIDGLCGGVRVAA